MQIKPLHTLYLLALFVWFLPANAQQRPTPTSARSITYGFVSPNTSEGLKLDDAIRGLSSSEEATLIKRAHTLRCVAQSSVEAYKAVGSWSDGAEHAVMLRVQTDAPTMRYMVSVLGRSAQQKASLYFQSNSSGASEIYILRPRNAGTIRRISQALDEAGIEFRTLVPMKTTILIYVVDLKRELRTKISAVAKKLKARITSRRGSGEFIGDDSSREKAKDIFEEEIRNYESQNSALITKCGTSNRGAQR